MKSFSRDTITTTDQKMTTAPRSINAEVRAVASIAARHKKMRFLAENHLTGVLKLHILMCGEFCPDRAIDLCEKMDLYKNLKSDVFNITSIIKEYKHRSGVMRKGHFAQDGEYLRDAKTGEKPMVYGGRFLIRKDAFTINRVALAQLCADIKECDEAHIEIEINDIRLAALFDVKDSDDLPLHCMGNSGVYGKRRIAEEVDENDDDAPYP